MGLGLFEAMNFSFLNEKQIVFFSPGLGRPADTRPITLANADDRRRWRLTTALRYPLALPHIYLAELWTLLALTVGVANWFITLARGRTPLALHGWFERYLRYTTHVGAYALLLADPYPKFRGWPGTYPVDLRVGPPVAQSRWKIAIRIQAEMIERSAAISPAW